MSVQEAENVLELQDTIGKILINILEEQAKNDKPTESNP